VYAPVQYFPSIVNAGFQRGLDTSPLPLEEVLRFMDSDRQSLHPAESSASLPIGGIIFKSLVSRNVHRRGGRNFEAQCPRRAGAGTVTRTITGK
jgi:hypothetical protein